jgi:hypothetical protein
MPLTQDEINAIENAITAGIDEALERMLVNPFPKPLDGNPPDYWSIKSHAGFQIKNAVVNKLRAIKPVPATPPTTTPPKP